jgi:Zn-dependent peptidase ImmA (M78 family)
MSATVKVSPQAKKLQVPVGLLLLSEPPLEDLPLPDLRSVGQRGRPPSGNLLDTIYVCQQRQQWCREHSAALEDAGPRLPLSEGMGVSDTSAILRAGLSVREAQRKDAGQAFAAIADAIERCGALVMVAGMFRDFKNRILDITEFRCVVMSDETAPLIFINGRDSKEAQIFSLVSGYLRACLGCSGVDDVEVYSDSETSEESWHMRVVAETLMPRGVLPTSFDHSANLGDELAELGNRWRVTPLAVCRQAFDAGLIDEAVFESEYSRFKKQAENYANSPRTGSSGNYYHNIGARVGKRFARAVVRDTFDGGTLFRDAYQLFGIKSHQTFARFCAYVRSRGVSA